MPNNFKEFCVAIDQNCGKIQNIIKSVPFMQLHRNGSKAALDGDTLTMDMPFANQLSRMTKLDQSGHGGAISALIDSAATFGFFRLEHGGVPTINYRTDF